MPMRLLFYIVEVWREILKNTSKNEKRRKDLIRRLRLTAYALKKITPEQFDILRTWLKGIMKPKLDYFKGWKSYWVLNFLILPVWEE